MPSRILVLGALALACVIAAGGGAYLAVRQSHNSQAVAAEQATPETAQSASPRATPTGMVTTPPAAGDLPAATATEPTPLTDAPAVNPAPPSPKPAPAQRHQASRKPARTEQETEDRPFEPPTPQSSATVPPDTSSSVPQTQAQPAGQAATEPKHEFVEVTVPAESVVGLQVQTAVSSETARIEDRVDARVTRDVSVNDRVAIPAGSRVLGSVVQVDRGGKVKERAHFAIRFHTLILPDGTRTSLNAEALHREGPSPANKSAARIGGAAVGGAILGAILGGGKGAAIGGAIGGAGGTAATMATDREPAVLAAGSIVNVRLMAPITVTLER